MKTFLISFLLLTSTDLLFSQHEIPSNKNNGSYYLLEPERGINNKPTNTKLFEFGDNNGTSLLAIAACEKCVPAVYTYQDAQSKRLGIPVFFNKMGFYIFGYKTNSFVIVLVSSELGKKPWSNFSFINFYSKNKSQMATVTKAEIKQYVIDISKK